MIITHHLIVYQLDTFTCLKMWLTVNMSECPPGISSLLKNQRIIQGATYTMTMVLCQILCLSAMVTCKDVFLLISFFTFIINHCTTLNGNQHRMGVILYMKIHPLLYWCYTVESLVNKKLMQLPVIQSLLPHTLFWNNFRYFCLCVYILVLLLHLLFTSSFQIPEPPSPILN